MDSQELEKLLGKSQDDLLADWYNAELAREVGGESPDLVAGRADLRKLFQNWSRDNLAVLLCETWGYCEKRKAYGKTMELVAQVGEFLYSTLKMPLPLPFSLAVLIVMHGFDRFCDCPGDV